MNDGQKVSGPARVLMAEAVRLIEGEGPLDDAQVMRDIVAGQDDRDSRLLTRAWRLGQRLGLDAQLARWRGVAAASLLALVALVVVGALGAAGSVVHSGRTVNAVAAFFTLLGLHGLSLLLWLIGLVAPWPSSGGALGRLWLELVARVATGRHAHAASLLQAGIGLLRRQRLSPWLFGWVSHTVWALSFVVMLAALWFAFSFQAYRLTWETTILGPDFFVRFVRGSGGLPAWLGFPVPDTATLLAPGAAAADQRAWAWWLIGCVVAYGLLPRVALAVGCAAVWRWRVKALRLDTADPYYRRLLTRLDALQPALVVDAEAPWPAGAGPGRATTVVSDAAEATGATALIGFELPPESPWPPLPLPHAPALSRRIAGTSQERTEVLGALRQLRPARVLLACHAASSPDRGTARFVREACGGGVQCRLLLVDAARAADGVARWAAWLPSLGLAQIDIAPDPQAAADWLSGFSEAAHG